MISSLIITSSEAKVTQESVRLEKYPVELTEEGLTEIREKLRSLLQLCLTGASV